MVLIMTLAVVFFSTVYSFLCSLLSDRQDVRYQFDRRRKDERFGWVLTAPDANPRINGLQVQRLSSVSSMMKQAIDSFIGILKFDRPKFIRPPVST